MALALKDSSGIAAAPARKRVRRLTPAQQKVMAYYGDLANRADNVDETNSINVSKMSREEILKVIRGS